MYKSREFLRAALLVSIFFILYLTLSLVTHFHYLSGYDLAIVNQYVYEWSHFKIPISTVSAYPFLPFYTDHIEIIFLLISPFYLLFSNAITILVLQSFVVAVSGFAIFLLCKKYNINPFLSMSLLISYLSFYGMQYAIYYDAHSLVFGAAFLAFFIYFLDKHSKWSIVFFLLAILSKEDISLLTLLISFVVFVLRRDKLSLSFFIGSFLYLAFIFLVVFPHVSSGFAQGKQKEINFDLRNFANTSTKREVIVYSLGWFGFLPLLLPVYLLPFLGDLFHYFVLGVGVSTAQGFYYHYRVTIAILLVYPTILVASRYRKINNHYVGVYLVCCAMVVTYLLHAPFTYFSKKWFWTQPPSVRNITTVLLYLPPNAAVVSQNNISPHISNRMNIFTLWPEKKVFQADSPCGKVVCNWFSWSGKVEYMIVDTSQSWDARHFLTSREDFIDGLQNMEHEKIIAVYKQSGTAVVYRVLKNP